MKLAVAAGNGSPHDAVVINPSIGQIGAPYYDSGNDRIKQLSPRIFTASGDLEREIAAGRSLMAEHSAGRFTARYFIRGDIVPAGECEANIPLEPAGEPTRALALAYIGFNLSDRTETQETIAQEHQMLSEILASAPKITSRFPDGYTIEQLTEPHPCDVAGLVSLYQEAYPRYTAPLDEQSVKAMIESSIVYIARHAASREIASVCVGEIAKIPTGEGPFVISELSEMATRKEHRGKGLVTHVTKQLLSDPQFAIDLAYAEARAPSRAINTCFHHLGFTYAGTLAKHCVISGDAQIHEQGPYENLNVWYYLPKGLQ